MLAVVARPRCRRPVAHAMRAAGPSPARGRVPGAMPTATPRHSPARRRHRTCLPVRAPTPRGCPPPSPTPIPFPPCAAGPVGNAAAGGGGCAGGLGTADAAPLAADARAQGQSARGSRGADQRTPREVRRRAPWAPPPAGSRAAACPAAHTRLVRCAAVIAAPHAAAWAPWRAPLVRRCRCLPTAPSQALPGVACRRGPATGRGATPDVIGRSNHRYAPPVPVHGARGAVRWGPARPSLRASSQPRRGAARARGAASDRGDPRGCTKLTPPP